MKKLFTLIVALTFIAPFSLASASFDDNQSFYIFHLEFKQDVLSQNKDIKFPYDIIPGEYVSTAKGGDFYGEIVSGHKVSLTRVWFDKPTTSVPAAGKSIVDVRAPYFANADHVTFFTAAGKTLFTISLAGSSFCNDNNKCNKEVGEDSNNCPNDCPPTPGEQLQVAPIELAPEVISTPPPATIASIPVKSEPATNTNTTVEADTTTTSPRNIAIPLTVGVSLVLLSVLGWVAWKRRASSEYN